MARKPNPHKLAQIYAAIEKHPGSRPASIARLLGVPRSEVTRALPALEEHGYYLSEDRRGGLWPFKPVSRAA